MTKVKNWYATVNRSGKGTDGTKIKLTEFKHLQTLKFVHSKWKEICELHLKSSKSLPSFILDKEDWAKIEKELRLGNKDDKFTKIFSGQNEVCILCSSEYREELMRTEWLRNDAEKQRREERVKMLADTTSIEKLVLKALREEIEWKEICLKSNPKKLKAANQKALTSLIEKEIAAFDPSKKKFVETKV